MAKTKPTQLQYARAHALDTQGNQIVAHHGDDTSFFSYGDRIALETPDKTYIYPGYSASLTTSKYLSGFMGESRAKIEEKLRDGIYEYMGDM